MSRRIFVDTNVLIFAIGERHPYRDPCRRLLATATAGDLDLHSSVEALQEFCFHRLRRGHGREGVAREARQLRAVASVHAFDDKVLQRMIELLDTTTVGGRDAVHAATALEHGFTEIVTADQDFDHVPGLRRVDPRDA